MGSPWRKAPLLVVWLLLILCWHSSKLLADCREIPAGQTMRVRLIHPLSSYSDKAGMPVRAMVVESPQCDGLPFFERGTEVTGRVTSVHRVGLGFRHEAAALEVEFGWISPDTGASLQMSAQVIGIDDARETIKNGVIHGITPEDSIERNMLVPVPLSHLAAWNPYSYWMTPVFKAVFPISPEPEIYFPAGTDLRIQLTAPLDTGGIASTPANPQFPDAEKASLDQLVGESPQRSYNTKGVEADVVNLMFIGSDEQIANAFRIAGWVVSDPLSTHSVLHGMKAILADKSDPTLPMAHHLLNGLPADFTLEKSLDSPSKRDHLRIWSQPQQWNGQSVWLSASTAEVGASFSLRHQRFEHHVNPQIDDERQKIVRDLSMAGCVASVYNAPRPGMAHDMETTSGTPLHTDGALAVVRLTNCELPLPEELAAGPDDSPASNMPVWRPTKFSRFVRTEVLAVRNIWRDNPAYSGYQIARATTHAIERRHKRQSDAVVATVAPSAPQPFAGPLTGSATAPHPESR